MRRSVGVLGVHSTRRTVHTCEDWGFKKLDKLVYLDEHIDCHFEVGTSSVSICLGTVGQYLQDLEQMVGLLIRLSKEAEREGCHGVVTPRLEERDKERLGILYV